MFSIKDAVSGQQRSLLLGTGIALLGVMTCFAVARVVGQQFVVLAGARGLQPVPLGAAVAATLAGGLAAYGLARLASRTARPRRTFGLLAAAGLLLSALPPLQAAADVGTAVWLLVLHGVVAAAVLPPVAAGLPRRRAPHPGRPTPPPTAPVLLSAHEEIE